MNLFKKFSKDKKGATAIEYGLIAALIAVVIIAGARTVGTSLNGVFGNINTELTGLPSSSSSSSSSSSNSTNGG